MTYPFAGPSDTFGGAYFWAEEYWATRKLQTLQQQYPNLDLTGFINESFHKRLSTLLDSPPHAQIVGTSSYADFINFNPPFWEDHRRFINLSPSHAPSRFIAEDYYRKHSKTFGIVTLDAHLDLTTSAPIHAAWLTAELAERTAIVGGWSEVSADTEQGTQQVAFLVPNLEQLVNSEAFRGWLNGKHLYITIDIDYFASSKEGFFGLANYWHREKIIGHTMTIEQIMGEYPTIGWLGEYWGYSRQKYLQMKKYTIKKNISELIQAVKDLLVCLQAVPSTSLLGIDFVEYSPLCDWNELTLNSFSTIYPTLWTLLAPLQVESPTDD